MQQAGMVPLPVAAAPPRASSGQGGPRRAAGQEDGFRTLLAQAVRGRSRAGPGRPHEAAADPSGPGESVTPVSGPLVVASGAPTGVEVAGLLTGSAPEGAGAREEAGALGAGEASLLMDGAVAEGGRVAEGLSAAVALAQARAAEGPDAEGQGPAAPRQAAAPLEGTPADERALEAFARRAAEVFRGQQGERISQSKPQLPGAEAGRTGEQQPAPGPGQPDGSGPPEQRATFGELVRLLARHHGRDGQGAEGPRGLGEAVREQARSLPEQAAAGAGSGNRSGSGRPEGRPVRLEPPVMPVEPATGGGGQQGATAAGQGGGMAGTQPEGAGRAGAAALPGGGQGANGSAGPIPAAEAAGALTAAAESRAEAQPAGPAGLTPAEAGGPPASPVEAEAAREAQRPVHPERLLEQVSRFVRVMVEGDRSEARFHLHPRHLGSIAVRLVVEDGVVTARLLASDFAAKAALEANLDQLRTRLADQGLQVEQVHVTVGHESGSGASHPFHHGSRQTGHGQPHHRGGQEAGGHGQPQPEQPHPERPTWRPAGTGRRLDHLA